MKERLVATRATTRLPTPHKTELAARLKQLRAEHGLSLSQLARATGISSSFLSLLEQAQSDITIGRLARLAEFYDVELADLSTARRPRPPTIFGSSAPRPSTCCTLQPRESTSTTSPAAHAGHSSRR